ncbi:MAG: Leu/Phe/Val dehydrogenase [Rhizobiaceae bacterium]
MLVFSHPDFDKHEFVHAFFDASSGLKGFIAVHSTACGPAMGGCRLWPYSNDDQALKDVLRLSRSMSYKNALAELPYGGGKAVIIGNQDPVKSAALFASFGGVVESLGGRYITAEDVGTCVEDMRSVSRATSYVSGIPRSTGYQGGDPSPVTARGVFEGMQAAVDVALGRSNLAGLTVAVQGVGNVGYHLCKYLHEAGARLIVADINADNVSRAVREFGATCRHVDEILSSKADVLAPCALGGILNRKSIPQLRVKVVAGAANNQLESCEDGRLLQANGIVFAPDYVINSGGIISVAAEHQRETSAEIVIASVKKIRKRTHQILTIAQESNLPPNDVADNMARNLIAGKRSAEQEVAA